MNSIIGKIVLKCYISIPLYTKTIQIVNHAVIRRIVDMESRRRDFVVICLKTTLIYRSGLILANLRKEFCLNGGSLYTHGRACYPVRHLLSSFLSNSLVHVSCTCVFMYSFSWWSWCNLYSLICKYAHLHQSCVLLMASGITVPVSINSSYLLRKCGK